MEESEEIKELILKAAKAYEEGDADFWVKLMAQEAKPFILGTDPTEWFIGNDIIYQYLKPDWGAKKTFTINMGEVHAFSEGTMGWFVVKCVYKYDNGSELPLRINGVVHRESGKWKLVLQNFTLAVPVDKKGLIAEKWNF